MEKEANEIKLALTDRMYVCIVGGHYLRWSTTATDISEFENNPPDWLLKARDFALDIAYREEGEIEIEGRGIRLFSNDEDEANAIKDTIEMYDKVLVRKSSKTRKLDNDKSR